VEPRSMPGAPAASGGAAEADPEGAQQGPPARPREPPPRILEEDGGFQTQPLLPPLLLGSRGRLLRVMPLRRPQPVRPTQKEKGGRGAQGPSTRRTSCEAYSRGRQRHGRRPGRAGGGGQGTDRRPPSQG